MLDKSAGMVHPPDRMKAVTIFTSWAIKISSKLEKLECTFLMQAHFSRFITPNKYKNWKHNNPMHYCFCLQMCC